MVLRNCKCRVVLEGAGSFFCENPAVVVRDGLVNRSMCSTCPFVDAPRPAAVRRWGHAGTLLPPLSVAVVIPCHNYGRYLADAIESALSQSVPPKEILVVIDRSDDDSVNVAHQYRDKGVQAVSVDFGNVHDVRRFGFLKTKSNILCFLDADDRLGPDYLEQGLAQFDADDVGVVYSDLRRFGSTDGVRSFPETFSRAALSCENFMHAGSLVRRDVLELTDAFATHLESRTASCTGDWWLWRCVAADGWQARKQNGHYFYRRHSESALATHAKAVSYFEAAWLERETLTLFVPLSGRSLLWPKMAAFLEQQEWPHSQIRLILFDTSQNGGFSRTVREWVASCDYADVRFIQRSVGPPRLADRPRQQSAEGVRRSMARIYNFLRCEVITELVWILEDDIIPPRDVAKRLLEQLDERTVSVAAPYRSRFHKGYVAWDDKSVSYREPQEGVTKVGGNGFGCTILRSDVIRQTAFSHGHRLPDFDGAFYASLQAQGKVKKINWNVECLHLSATGLAEDDAAPQAQPRIAGGI